MWEPERRYEGFIPGRFPVQAYGDGGFRFADISHRGSIMLLPSGILAFEGRSVQDLTLQILQPLLNEIADFDLLLIGTGKELTPIPKPLREDLREAGIRFEPMQTGAAIHTYNIMLDEERRVAAVLLVVD